MQLPLLKVKNGRISSALMSSTYCTYLSSFIHLLICLLIAVLSVSSEDHKYPPARRNLDCSFAGQFGNRGTHMRHRSRAVHFPHPLPSLGDARLIKLLSVQSHRHFWRPIPLSPYQELPSCIFRILFLRSCSCLYRFPFQSVWL